MGYTLFDKIWNQHVVKSVDQNLDVLYIDQHFVHEVTSPQAFAGLEERNVGVFRPENTLATADHNVPTKNRHLPISNQLSRNQVETLEINCKKNNIKHFGLNHELQGIVHVIGPELGYTRPGMTIVCGDSHTSTHGAFGTIAFGIGTTQVEQVLAAQCLLLSRPKTMRINVSGNLSKGVSAKDVILYIISKIGTEGANGHFVEFSGDVFSNMSMEERMTVCNMSIEMGARGGLVGVDQTTIKYVLERATDLNGEIAKSAVAYWNTLHTDTDASFDKQIDLEAAEIVPMVTCGTAPDTAIPINQAIGSARNISKKALAYMGFAAEEKPEDQQIDYVFIGSCTNGRIEDLRAAASVVGDLKKAEHVSAWIVPGSQRVLRQAISEGLDKIFKNAGFEFRAPGCSACLAMNDDKIPAGALCASTSNRNFEGRQGPGARTMLMSPTMAAAAAIAGKIVNPVSYFESELI